MRWNWLHTGSESRETVLSRKRAWIEIGEWRCCSRKGRGEREGQSVRRDRQDAMQTSASRLVHEGTAAHIKAAASAAGPKKAVNAEYPSQRHCCVTLSSTSCVRLTWRAVLARNVKENTADPSQTTSASPGGKSAVLVQKLTARICVSRDLYSRAWRRC